MSKKILIIISIILCIAAGFGILYFTSILPANKVLLEVRNLEIRDIDLQQVADGKYNGEFSYSKTNCKVEVDVRNHKIESIAVLENGKTSYAKKAEAVVDKVIDEQKINVDIISGATTTSKALLKAVENALSSGVSK